MRKYALNLIGKLNKEYDISFNFIDFRSISRFMDSETRNLFKTSPGFAFIRKKNNRFDINTFP